MMITPNVHKPIIFQRDFFSGKIFIFKITYDQSKRDVLEMVDFVRYAVTMLHVISDIFLQVNFKIIYLRRSDNDQILNAFLN